MSQGMIPSIGDKGTFTLKAPWVLDQKTEYTCVALRSFSEISKNGIDVYNTFYKPKGLSEDNYRVDTDYGVVMVALRSSVGNYIYVPSSYILSTPNGNGYLYSRRFISVDLGPIPTTLSTETLKENISELVLGNFGVQPTIKEVQVPILEVVNPNNHEALERGRKGKIKEQGTYLSRYNEALKVIEAQKKEIAQMTEKLIEAGIIVI